MNMHASNKYSSLNQQLMNFILFMIFNVSTILRIRAAARKTTTNMHAFYWHHQNGILIHKLLVSQYLDSVLYSKLYVLYSRVRTYVASYIYELKHFYMKEDLSSRWCSSLYHKSNTMIINQTKQKFDK